MTLFLKFEPKLSGAEHPTTRSWRLPTIPNIYECTEKEYAVSLEPEYARAEDEPAASA